jgi:hypothetical protein
MKAIDATGSAAAPSADGEGAHAALQSASQALEQVSAVKQQVSALESQVKQSMAVATAAAAKAESAASSANSGSSHATQAAPGSQDLEKKLLQLDSDLTEKVAALQAKISSVLQLLVQRVKALESKNGGA